mmetsp:Transcript_57881/g.141963  ORF Transcript_57881/g.141963 Transcript_57881/m.141963 type:complete len:311 (+) Transcript_57881:695-1627(+)
MVSATAHTFASGRMASMLLAASYHSSRCSTSPAVSLSTLCGCAILSFTLPICVPTTSLINLTRISLLCSSSAASSEALVVLLAGEATPTASSACAAVGDRKSSWYERTRSLASLRSLREKGPFSSVRSSVAICLALDERRCSRRRCRTCTYLFRTCGAGSSSWSSSMAASCRSSTDVSVDLRRSCSFSLSFSRISSDSARTARNAGTELYASRTGREVLQYLTASAQASSSTARFSLVGSSKMKESFLSSLRTPLSFWIRTRLSARFELILEDVVVMSCILSDSCAISFPMPSTLSFICWIVSVAQMNLL